MGAEAAAPQPEERYRDLPSVEVVLARITPRAQGFPRTLVAAEIRRLLNLMREQIRAGLLVDLSSLDERVERALAELARPSLRGVINATGVVLHTNLGRAPLGDLPVLGGYSNLEFDLATGQRGKRDVHISAVLERLLGRPGIAVNNNAAAVYLALNELAAGYEAIVSRGELIEIGDGFRIPEIIERSGAVLREVGTTNRTRIEDYREAIGERTRLILRVHPSNFRIQGFTARPALAELAALARERGVPLYEDLGSGCLADLSAFGVDEPLVAASLEGGANLVSFSGDKLLGGPQAGILAGDADLVARLRRNPIFRALRLDKLLYQALEETLRRTLLEDWERLPALRMIRLSAEDIHERAEAVASRLEPLDVEVIPGRSVIGGGATPEQSLGTWLIAVRADDLTNLDHLLRQGDPPVIARIEDDRLLLDLRTVLPEEEENLVRRLREACAC